MPKLVLTFKQNVIDAFPLTEGTKVTIGRHPGNDIVIDNLAVSGNHAALMYGEDTGWVISDLDSKNGTFINDQKIGSHSLTHKDAISIGKHVLLVDLEDTVAAGQTAGPVKNRSETLDNRNTMVLETPKDERPDCNRQSLGLPSIPEADSLEILNGGEGVIRLSPKGIVSIGRNQDADIVIGGIRGLLSGRPAVTIIKQAGDYFLRYAGGLIKPRRNGSGIKGTIKLNNNDVVSVGPVKVRVQLR